MKINQETVLKVVNRLDWALAAVSAVVAIFFAAQGHENYAYVAAGCAMGSAAMAVLQPARWAKQLIDKKVIRKAKEA